ncbi:HAMP domain-containing protein [Candidatus Sulfurimonas marisnigri]
MKDGNFDDELNIIRSDELGEISNAINSMRISIRQGDRRY